MKLDPQLKQAMSLWAEAQYAYSIRQWSAAHNFYSRALTIYEKLRDLPAAYKTIYQLYHVAKHLKNWSDMLGFANALLEYDRNGGFFGWQEETWLLVGHAERLCKHTAQARYALAESVRISESRTQPSLQNRESVPFVRWSPNEARIYAGALHEWGLLEADVGKITEAVKLIALGELILLKAIEAFPFDTEHKLSELVTELILLSDLMTSDRENLEKKRL